MGFRAAVLTGLNQPLEVVDIEVPKLDVGQVLVRIHASGICGAQIGEITGTKGPDPWLPHLLGHEGGGIVQEVGQGISNVKPGDHVVMHWRKGIGIEARPPRYRLTANDYLGKPHHEVNKFVGGGWITTFNEMAVVSENRLTKIPKDIPFDIAALMGCAVTTALGLINNEAKVKIGESVLVTGCGGVGLNVIQGARLAGAYPIIAMDRVDRSTMAKQEGAEFVFSLSNVKGPFDVVVETTGSPEIISACYNLLKPQVGRLILVGQPDCSCDLVVPGFRRHYCGKTVMDSQGGLTNPAVDIPRYVAMYRAGLLELAHFITHRFPLADVNGAIKTVMDGEAIRCILEMP